jgi:hypothetical protein
VPDTHVIAPNDPSVGSAEMAMQLLQFPFRQVFGPQGGGGAGFNDVFAPTVGVATLRDWSRGGQ